MKQQRPAFFRPIPLMVPGGVGVVLVAATLGDVLWYVFVPEHRTALIFATSVAAAFGLLLNAVNGIFMRQAQAEESDRTIREARAREAFDFMKRWNDPQFAQLRTEINVGIDANEKFVNLDTPAEIRTRAHLILNFLEMLAIAYWREQIDGDMCKDFFRSTVIYYEKQLGWYLDQLIKVRNQPSALENFRKLAATWRA